MAASADAPAGPASLGGPLCFPLRTAEEGGTSLWLRLGFPADAAASLALKADGLLLQADGVQPESLSALQGAAARAGVDVAHPGAGAKAVLLGSRSGLAALAHAAARRPGLEALGRGLADCLERMARPRSLVLRGTNLLAGRRFAIMGVLNVTPDSFSDGARYLEPAAAIARGLRLAQEGAHIVDLGAESSRPGSDRVPEDEEKRRLLPVLLALRKELPQLPLSVDTTKSGVAAAALDAGADMINDISGGTFDPELVPLCASRGAALVLMHMRGVPKTMQAEPRYEDVTAEVVGELRGRVRAAEAEGLGPGRLVVDPGFGFAKRPEDNLALVAHIGALSALGYPVLIGASRKSTIGALTGAPVQDRLPGSLALHTAALLRGASLFRVHDVKEHRQALDCAAALLS